VVLDFAVCTLTANIGIGFAARISALELDTGQGAGTFVVSGALGVASGEGVAEEVLRAGALGPVVAGVAVGILTASSFSADWFALELDALLVAGALVVTFALPAAAGQRIADVILFASADGSVSVSDLTVGVGTAGGANLVASKLPAASERIAGETARTPANCDVVLDGTLCAWTARETARVNAPVVLASLVGRTLRVGDTVASYARAVGITLVTRQAFADWAAIGVSALSIGATNFADRAGIRTAATP